MEYQELRGAVIAELDDALGRVDGDSLTAALDAIDDAPRIFVMGIGREGLASKAFAMRLTHYGKTVHWGWDDTTPNVSAGDLFILASGPGNIPHLHYIAEQVKKTGATLLVVTAYPDSPTPLLADLVLRVPAHTYGAPDGDVAASIQPMGTLFEQSLFVFWDLLYGLLVRRAGVDFSDLAARHRNFE
ncbi:SIS domain-containing protein [Leifsonia poae]|uniref:SIS domain-containing protein n=1 Tax=Leifsonia poae TaxID=110933 RepID=UPI001CBDE001|nr:SIS domain-containing protein [Leifsonia poae]